MFRIFIGYLALVTLHCAALQKPDSDPAHERLQQAEATNAKEQDTTQEILRSVTAVRKKLEHITTQVRVRQELEQQQENIRNSELVVREQQQAQDEKTQIQNTVFAVPIDGNAFTGPKHAKITMVEFFDYSCKHCESVFPTIEKLRKKYKRDLKVVYKTYILSAGSKLAAYASCAANKQNKFWALKKTLRQYGHRVVRNLTREDLFVLARTSGLHMARFKRDLDSKSCLARIENDHNHHERLGVNSVPTFFINGRKVTGSKPLIVFDKIIREELAKVNTAIANGAKLHNYYGTILATGKKTAY